jgi:hypothetical protein
MGIKRWLKRKKMENRSPSVHTEEIVNAENLAHVESPVEMREDVASESAVAAKEITKAETGIKGWWKRKKMGKTRKNRLASVHTEEMVNAENLALTESPVEMREDVALKSAVAVKEIRTHATTLEAPKPRTVHIRRPDPRLVKINFTPLDYSEVQPKIDNHWKAADKQKHILREPAATIRYENLMHAVPVRPKSGTVKIHFTPPDYSNVQPKVDDQWTAAEKKKYFDPCKPAARIEKKNLMRNILVHIRRQHPAKDFVKFQFKKTQYSKIKPKVDTWWKRHMRRQPAEGIVETQFMEQNYSKIKRKVETLRERHPLGGSSNEAANQDITRHENVITSGPTVSQPSF